MIKAVLFDVDDTLLDFKECSRTSIIYACKKTGIEYSDVIYQTFLTENQKLWWRLEKNELTRSDIYARRWNIIFNVLGIDFDGPAFEKIYKGRLNESHIPICGAVEILQYCKSKYITGVASNALYEQQFKRLSDAGMTNYIDHMFLSGIIGIEKPNEGFFAYCVEKLNLKPEEVLLVGDSITADINGAKKYGIQTCLFDRCHTMDKSVSDYYINNLLELKDIL